jgi:hypothetical protein
LQLGSMRKRKVINFAQDSGLVPQRMTAFMAALSVVGFVM